MSLRRRVLLGIVTVAAVLIVSNLVLATTFEDYLVDRVDEQLAETAHRPAFGRGGRGAPGPGGPREAQPLTDLFIGIADVERGTLVRFGSSLREDDPPAIPAAELLAQATAPGRPIEPFTATSADRDTSWRLAAVQGRIVGGDLLVVGVNLDDVGAILRRMELVQVLGTIAVLAALAGVSWWVLRLGVRPLVAMAATADEIAAGDLTRRAAHVDERTEAGRLGQAFNTMLSQIEAAFRERAASEERVRQFAADASHELRTPLTSIRGYAELWEAGGLRDPHELEEAMRRMGEEARRMGGLVEELLLLARLDQGRPLEREPVRLDHLVRDGVLDARAVQPARPITLEAVPAPVEGDERALRQIVANLLTNASVHTPPETPVHVSVERLDDRVRLEVADEGPGLPAAVAERVFERFFRADPSRTRHHVGGGTGLGLPIVRAVAEAHGGTAELVTAQGAGCRFVVTLPAADDSEVSDV